MTIVPLSCCQRYNGFRCYVVLQKYPENPQTGFTALACYSAIIMPLLLCQLKLLPGAMAWRNIFRIFLAAHMGFFIIIIIIFYYFSPSQLLPCRRQHASADEKQVSFIIKV